MNIINKIFLLLMLAAALIYSSCDSGIGRDLKEIAGTNAGTNDCSYIDVRTFNVTDGTIAGEWDQITNDTISDTLGDVADSSLDIRKALFVYDDVTYSLQFFIALNGPPNTLYDYMIDINGGVDYTLVNDYTTLWEAQLYSGSTFLNLQTVTETTDANGFEGEIYLGTPSGTVLTVYLLTRDSGLNTQDRTSTVCFTIP